MAEQDYTSYDAPGLAQDAGFIGWVRGTDAAAARFWERWLREHPERAAVVEEARRLVRAMRFAETPPAPARVEALWGRIDAAIAEEAAPERGRRIVMRPRRWLAIAAAACIGALLVAYWWNSSAWETITTGAGEQLTYVLPDSSTVQLNASTTISLRPNRWARARTVRLTGEAFFNVRRGSPFRVLAEEGSVEVLGTSFNVLSRNGRFAVDCFTGRVRVQARESTASTILTAGRGARLTPAAPDLVTVDFDSTQTATWRQGAIYYDAEPLGEVFRTLERQFDIRIETPAGIEQRTATGFFKLSNVDSALYDVTWPMNLEYRRDGRQVVIRERK